MEGNDDTKFIKRCLDLASRAEGMTYPNPMVGSVIVHENVIIGEGYHLKAGTAHAEVNAVNSVYEKSLLDHSTLYVSLEPCSHTGRTPPCTELIISNRIPRVVIGTTDTSDKVNGRGIARLKGAGIDVTTGVLEEECRRINRRFFTFNEKKRPYITLKWAESADGFMDFLRSPGQEIGPNWITGKPERVLVHKWRASEQAILVGAGTIRSDNPGLNVRYWKGNDPVRIIISNSGNLHNYLADNEAGGKKIIFTSSGVKEKGSTEFVKLKPDLPASLQVVEYMYNNKLQSLFIEGGASVLTHFIQNGLWDEARIFKGSANFKNGVKAPSIKGRLIQIPDFENSSLNVVLNEAWN